MPKIPTYKMKSRMMVVLVGMIVFGFIIILLQLANLQLLQGEWLQSRALSQQLRSERIGAKRGTIYDTNGKALARSATVYSVCIAPAQIDTDAKKDVVSKLLVDNLGVTPELVQKKLERKKSLYEVVKTKVEKPQADALMAIVNEDGTPGIFLEPDTRRYYPYGNFASTVLGFTNNDNVGAYGLESYYEKTLAGTAGRIVSLRNSRGVALDKQFEQKFDAKDGNSLVLTIDETIQHYLEKNMEMAVVEHKVGKRAAAIVMDVKTGAILAMTTKPDFDPNDPYVVYDQAKREEIDAMPAITQEQKDAKAKELSTAQFTQWRNKAISDPYEPGSVFKIVTASGALESGTITENSPEYYCPGYVDVAGKLRYCWVWGSRHEGHGMQNLEKAIMNSCNPAFIKIGQLMGPQLFSEYFSNYGLTAGTDIDLPGEATSIYYTADQMGIAELSSAAFGQTFKVTPIQLITAVSAAVNGGNLMQPYVVKQVLDPEGNVISNTEPVVKRQVISEEVSAQMRRLLENVVTGGSGKQAQIPGYRVGGKTGTSEKIGETDKNILSFYGFAPADDPQIGCLVMLDEPDIYNGYGSTIACPIVGAVLADVLPYMGIEPQFTQEELDKVATIAPSTTGKDIHDAMSIVRITGLKYRVIGNGTKVVKQVPGDQVPIPKGTTIVLFTEEEPAAKTVQVPDVVGMTATQANQALVNDAGLNISISGDGVDGAHAVAIAQNPAAGTEVLSGAIIQVEFQSSASAPESKPDS